MLLKWYCVFGPRAFINSAVVGWKPEPVDVGGYSDFNMIAPEAGGTAEILLDGVHGRIVPIGAVDRLIWGLQAALADPQRTRQMADGARRRVEGELSFESRCRRLERIYEEMMGHA